MVRLDTYVVPSGSGIGTSMVIRRALRLRHDRQSNALVI
jgi:hypothetical protein